MTFSHSSTVPHPLERVFAWHERRGAIVRLTPPWLPQRVLREATSLRDGRAVIGLPGGLRWVAAHRPDGYHPPRQFIDELTSPLLTWRHTHRFSQDAEGSTRVDDLVETPLPNAVLRSMFAYRHRQLAEDLDCHVRAHAWRTDPVTVAITGASGLIGTAVTALLTTGGHRVIRLVRRPPRAADERRWDPNAPAPGLLAGVDAVIHLAGHPLFGRFTDRHRAAIRESRVGPTHELATRAVADGVRVFVCASAVGFYGFDRGDEVLTESSPPGGGFLAGVVADWEAATAPAADADLRCVRVRAGVVQSPRGGALRIQYPIFATGLGGRLGDGGQWLSWIGIDDLADIYLRAVLDDALAGPINAVSPHPVRDIDHARVLAAVLRRPALIPVPAFGPRLLLGGQGAREIALADQRVVPDRLMSLKHHFRHPDLETALRHVLGRRGGGEDDTRRGRAATRPHQRASVSGSVRQRR